jgi:hypothetical protein
MRIYPVREDIGDLFKDVIMLSATTTCFRLLDRKFLMLSRVDILIERRQRTLRLHSSKQPVDLPALLPIGLLGPLELLLSLQVGETLQAFRCQPNGEKHEFAITQVWPKIRICLSWLHNFLSLEDCQRIQNQAKALTMESAETITKGNMESRNSCNVDWIQELPDIPLIGSRSHKQPPECFFPLRY